MTKQHREYTDEADEYRKDGEWMDAGNYYSSAAYAKMGELAPNTTTTGVDLRYFMNAVLCYRVGGYMSKCRNRSKMAILYVEDTKETVSDRNMEYDWELASLGKWDECIGDFRVVGGLDGAEDAYEEAEKTYREAGDPRLEDSAYIPENAMDSYFYNIAYAAGYDMDEYTERYKSWENTHTKWLEFRREHLPEFVDEIVSRGEWLLPEEGNE